MRRLVGGLLVAAAAMACSSSGSDEGATSASEVTTGDAGADAACIACTERYPNGAKKYDLARRHCFCADDVCRDECATTQCNGGVAKPADEPCRACIDVSYGACVQVVQAACESDAECLKYVLCKIDEPCDAER